MLLEQQQRDFRDWIDDAQSTDKEYFMPYTYYIVDDIKSKAIDGFEIPVAAIFEEKIKFIGSASFGQKIIFIKI